ncbi:MAG: T9SS type A sorting domain-containing protein [Flavobacteriaceae bacterium]|nr:T9SS type A sorting domain-containing protein [Flavobacteriaceae bacterium]
MKKIYFLVVAIMVTSLSFGQDLIITGVFDGPLSGGTPKLTELYVVNDIADLSLYGIGSANNGQGTDGEEFTFSADAYTAGDFIYVATEGSNLGSFNTYFGFEANYLDDSMGINGDDAVELFFNGSVIDTFGDINVDGSGELWEYLDGWAYRNDATGPDGTTFILGNWSFSGTNVNDGQTDNGTATTPFPIGTYVITGTPDPTISITSPSIGTLFAPGVTSIDVEFTTANTTGGEQVNITVNGTQTTNVTSPFAVITADGTSYDVTVDLVNGGILNSSTTNFSVGTLNAVANLAALRAAFSTQIDGTVYTLTNEVFINYATSFRNQKFIEDATGGILIDDAAGNITSGVRGDGLTEISGTLSEFNNMLQFTPIADAVLATPSTLTITPQMVTLAELTTNAEDYESELVKVTNVLVDNSMETTFVNNTDYPMTQDADTFLFRTFFSVDYTDTDVPTVPQDIVGLIIDRTGVHSLGARDLADFATYTASLNDNEIEGFSLYPNPVTKGKVVITTLNASQKNIELYNIIGKRIYTNSFTGTQIEVNFGKLNSGVYFLKVKEGTYTTISKLVVK